LSTSDIYGGLTIIIGTGLGKVSRLNSPNFIMINTNGIIVNNPLSQIQLTDAAKGAVQRFQRENSEFRGKELRLYLEGKGCDGFYYGVTFDDATSNDIRFEQCDQGTATKIVDLVVDPDTLQFVEGVKIDWADDERGRGFLVDNPNQKAFRGKFFKRESWKRKLTSVQPHHGN
jgi:iron-sulfur cluster assembly accessory protein